MLPFPKVADLLKFCGEFFNLYYVFKIETYYLKLGFGEEVTFGEEATFGEEDTPPFLELFGWATYGSIACELAEEAFRLTQSMDSEELEDTGGECTDCEGWETA